MAPGRLEFFSFRRLTGLGNRRNQVQTVCEAPWTALSFRSRSYWRPRDRAQYDNRNFQCELDKGDWVWLCNCHQTSPVWVSTSSLPCHTTWPSPSNPSPPLEWRMNNLEDLGKQSPPFLQSQLGEGVELFIDLLGGTSHPLTSKPALKSAREGMAFFAACIVAGECKKWSALKS